MTNYVRLVKESDQQPIMMYESAFLRSADLEYLDASDQAVVVDHLLAQFSENAAGMITKTMVGISRYLTDGDVRRFLDPIASIMSTSETQDTDWDVHRFLRSEYSTATADVQEAILRRLDMWVAHETMTKNEDGANRLNDTKSYVIDAVPF